MRKYSPPTSRFDKGHVHDLVDDELDIVVGVVVHRGAIDPAGEALPGRLVHRLGRKALTRAKGSIGPPIVAGLGPRIREVLNEMSPKGEFEPEHPALFVDENPFFAPYPASFADLGRPRWRQPAMPLNY